MKLQIWGFDKDPKFLGQTDYMAKMIMVCLTTLLTKLWWAKIWQTQQKQTAL